MDLSYSAEQELLRRTAMRFLVDNYSFAARRRSLGEPEGFSRSKWSEFAELGWLGMPISEAAGGFGGDAVDLSIIMEALGSALAVEPYQPTIVAAAGAIQMLGDSEQQALLPSVVSGDTLLAFAHRERAARVDPTKISTTAVRKGGSWILNGTKSVVLAGGIADVLVISALLDPSATDQSAVGLFLVSKESRGLEIDRYPIVDGRIAADVIIRSVTVGPDALLGRSERAMPVIESITDREVAAGCAEMVGGLDYVLRATCEYTGARVQFGKPIRSFQVIQHRLAQMRVMCAEARAITLFATLSLGAPAAYRARAASAAKVKVGRAARYVVQQSVQLHGGMGVTDELNIATYLKHVAAFESLLGSAEYHRSRYRKLLEGGGIHVDEGLVGSRALEAVE